MTYDENRFHALKFALQYFDALDIGAGPESVIQVAGMFSFFLDGKDPVTAPQVQADSPQTESPRPWIDEPNDWIDETCDPDALADAADPDLADLTESYPEEDEADEAGEYPLNDWVSEMPDEPVAEADSPQEVPAAVDLSPEETQFFANIYSAAAEPQPEPNPVEQDPASITELDELDETPETFTLLTGQPEGENGATQDEISEAVMAIASEPPAAPDASDDAELTDEQVELAEDRQRDNHHHALAAGQQSLQYVNTLPRTKWPWMP